MSTELLAKFQYLIVAVLIIIATFVVAYLVKRFFKRIIKRSAEVLQSDTTTYQFVQHVAVGAVYLVGFSLAIYTVPALRTVASSLLAGAGILAVAVGFAAQNALSNVIGGLFIIIFKPFRIGDRLVIRDTMSGVVEDISIRHTVIRNFENRRIIIPNSIISNEIIVNSDFIDDKICRWIDVGISYGSDIDLAKSIVADEVGKHPLFVDPRTEEQKEKGTPMVTVRVLTLGESSVNLRAWAWAKDTADAFVLNCDLLESIKKRFDREGVEIPFPHRTLVYKDGGRLTVDGERSTDSPLSS
ncbi:MAG: mechanosensitive ion channel family protein [Bacteroidota bacterium]